MKKSNKLTHKEKLASRTKHSLITRVNIFTLVILFCIFGIIIVPKSILNYDTTYQYAIAKSFIEDESKDLALYDYDVYATEKKFILGLQNDIPRAIKKAKEDNKIIVVKLPGLKKERHNFDNYILMYDPETPELNIEYYVVQNLYLFNMTVPTVTFLTLLKDIEPKVNLGYIITISIIASILVISFGISDINNILELKRRKFTEKNITN